MVDDRTWQSTPTAGKPRKTTVRQLDDPNHGRVWRVEYACGCCGHSFRTWRTALLFAIHHACPAPWAPIPAAWPLVRGGVR